MPLQIAKSLLLAAAITAGGAPLAQAKALKWDPVAATGCAPLVTTRDADAVIHRFGIHTTGALPAETRTLGAVLTRIEKMNDNRPLAPTVLNGFEFKYMNGKAHSEQLLNGVVIHRTGGMHFGTNQAQLVHELAHKIGNNAGGYEAYQNVMHGSYCIVSGYSSPLAKQAGTYRSHEQFAEVFAAYVTRPDLIRNSKSLACKKAFHYFSDIQFPHSAPMALACMAHQKKVNGALINDAILKRDP